MKRILVMAFCLLSWAARAQGTGHKGTSTDPPQDSDPSALIQIELEIADGSDRASVPSSEVLTAEYRSRMLNQASWMRSRYGLWQEDLTTPAVSIHRSSRADGRSGPVLAQELRLVAGRPFMGLRLDQQNVLMAGDQLSLRSGSDLQTLARLTDAALSESESTWLSLLGWRSRSELHWKAGDPARQLQWQVNAAFDRHAASQKGTIEFRVLRQF